MNATTTVTAGILAVGLGLALQPACLAAKRAPAKHAPAKAAQATTVTIDGGYSPAVVNVKAGQPVKLTFVRKEKQGCGEEVQFPSLNLKRTLKPGEKTVVTFTPKKAGEIPFTCGMKMYEGKVVAK
jgi:plastocyanin domain-containing protein